MLVQTLNKSFRKKQQRETYYDVLDIHTFSQTPRAPLHCLLAVAAVLLHTMGSDHWAHCRHVLDAGTNHTQLLLQTTKGPKWLDQVNQPKLQENPTHQYTTVLSLGKEWSPDMLPRHNYICEGAGKIYRTVFEQAKYTELFFFPSAVLHFC